MKFGVRECADICFKAKAPVKIGSHVFGAMEPVLYLDTAKTSTLESASTTVYATGGRGNARLLAWEGEKTLTFTVEDALISDMGLAILSGADLLYANGSAKKTAEGGAVTPASAGTQVVIAHTTQTFQLGDNKKATFKGAAPYTENDTAVYAMILDNNGEMSGIPVKLATTDYSISNGEITISSNLFVVGDTVLLDYYVEHYTDAIQIDITPDKFAGYYYVEASTLYRRQVDGVDLPAEIIIPKVKIQSNFTFTMASSGDPSTFTFTMDAFPDYTAFDKTKKVLCSMQILNADDNFDAGEALEPTKNRARHEYNVNDGAYFAGAVKTADDAV